MEEDLVKNLQGSINQSSSTPDAVTKASKSIYQDQYDAATVENFIQNQIARQKYSHRIFLITCYWLSAVLLILILSGFKVLNLPTSVLLALIGTTTINVLGFFVIVIQYLFNKEKST